MEVEDDESFEIILVAATETGTFVRSDVARLGNDLSGSVTIKDTDSGKSLFQARMRNRSPLPKMVSLYISLLFYNTRPGEHSYNSCQDL